MYNIDHTVRSLIITDDTNNRVGIKFIGPDSVALNAILSHIDPGTNYSVRFTNSSRNLRNTYWILGGETQILRHSWDR